MKEDWKLNRSRKEALGLGFLTDKKTDLSTL